MKKYDDIVVGSGISGLTMTLLLAMSGHRVLLLEKGPHIGGSLSRFSKRGVPFDTGFHFTGGLHERGILSEILSFLGMRDLIHPLFLRDDAENQFIFESHGMRFEHPTGIENVKNRFKDYFPSETDAIDRYFGKVLSVCERTPSLNLHANIIAPPNLDEDYVTLDEVLKGLTANALLRGLLSGYAMCYGVRPDEISFANHSRMCLSFYESVAFVKDGGDAFIEAFQEKFKEYEVDVRCGAVIEELADISDSKVGRFVLNTGEEVTADSCVLTIHPRDILSLLPSKHYTRAFMNRVSSFEASAGFFSVFATLREGTDPYPTGSIVSLFPNEDVNKLLDPGYAGQQALVIIKSPDSVAGATGKGVCILEPSFPEHVSAWSGSRRGKRPQDYLDYKEARVQRIKDHIFSVFPGYRESLDFIAAGSVLTAKDYLNSPDGSAYGVKQKMGQFNLIGKLPLHNLYAAGQSSLLPGIIGAMMSSLIVGRAVVGKEQFGRLLNNTACH
ncbi:MAG TPA: NAD(P)/FAD-dependent oxidoreductase [Nitrospirota bacterium]